MKLLSIFKRKSKPQYPEAVVTRVKPRAIELSGGYTTVEVWRIVGRDKNCLLKIAGTNDSYYMPVWAKVRLADNKKNLLTNNGRDWMHAQIYTNTAAGTRGSGYIAVTNNAGAPAAGDTSLTGELTGGLARADATTKTHNAGTNSTLIEHTFTADATVTGIQKTGLFNAASGVTLSHENTFTSADVVSGDTLKVSWTCNAG